MKKKVLALALVVALAAVAVTGTLAWFTDTDKATNTFTIGSIDVDIKEDFTQPEHMLPVVDNDMASSDPNYVKKQVWVDNTGKNPAFVQLYIAVPKVLDDADMIHVVECENVKWIRDTIIKVYTDPSSNIQYNVYKYVYTEAVAPGAITDHVIEAVYLDEKLDYNNNTGKFKVMGATEDLPFSPNGKIDILVFAQAVQAEGFGENHNIADLLKQSFGDEIPNFN